MLRAFCSPYIDFCSSTVDETNVLCFKKILLFIFCYLFILNFLFNPFVPGVLYVGRLLNLRLLFVYYIFEYS